MLSKRLLACVLVLFAALVAGAALLVEGPDDPVVRVVAGPAVRGGVLHVPDISGAEAVAVVMPYLEGIAIAEAEEAARVAEEEARQAALRAAQSQARVSQPAPAAQATPVAPDASCGGVNSYAAFIYQRESGCNPAAVNGSGCRGIGQACPGSKLPCDADFACQHAWFEGYAISRYGSWEAAYAFWLRNHWW